MEWYRILTVPSSPVLPNYMNLVMSERPGAAAELHVASFGFFMIVLVWFLHAAE